MRATEEPAERVPGRVGTGRTPRPAIRPCGAARRRSRLDCGPRLWRRQELPAGMGDIVGQADGFAQRIRRPGDEFRDLASRSPRGRPSTSRTSSVPPRASVGQRPSSNARLLRGEAGDIGRASQPLAVGVPSHDAGRRAGHVGQDAIEPLARPTKPTAAPRRRPDANLRATSPSRARFSRTRSSLDASRRARRARCRRVPAGVSSCPRAPRRRRARDGRPRHRAAAPQAAHRGPARRTRPPQIPETRSPDAARRRRCLRALGASPTSRCANRRAGLRATCARG